MSITISERNMMPPTDEEIAWAEDILQRARLWRNLDNAQADYEEQVRYLGGQP